MVDTLEFRGYEQRILSVSTRNSYNQYIKRLSNS